MVNVKCCDCDLEFGVTEGRAEIRGDRAHVINKGFTCPYCCEGYTVGDALDLVGVSGGVNIKGHVHVKGDIAGRDIIKR
mgnify:CR=1 FL=1